MVSIFALTQHIAWCPSTRHDDHGWGCGPNNIFFCSYLSINALRTLIDTVIRVHRCGDVEVVFALSKPKRYIHTAAHRKPITLFLINLITHTHTHSSTFPYTHSCAHVVCAIFARRRLSIESTHIHSALGLYYMWL